MSGTTTSKSKAITPAPAKPANSFRSAAEAMRGSGNGATEVKKTKQGSIPLVFVRPAAKQYVKPSKKYAGKQVVLRPGREPVKPKPPAGKSGKSGSVAGKARPAQTGKNVSAGFAARKSTFRQTSSVQAGEHIDVKTPLTLFRTEHAQATSRLAGDLQLRKTQILIAGIRERKNIQQTVATQSAATARIYLDTIKAVQGAPDKARQQSVNPAVNAGAQMLADARIAKQKHATTAQNLTGQLTQTENKLTLAATLFGNSTTIDLHKHTNLLKGRSGQSVFEIAAGYRNKDEYSDILEDLGEMSTEFGEGLDEVRDDVVEDINDDISDLHESFANDIVDSKEKISEAREKADESADELAQGGVEQIPEFIQSVIEELRKQTTSISAELTKAMFDSMEAIRMQGNKALAAVNEQERNTLNSLQAAYLIKQKQFTALYVDVMQQLPDLPDTLAVDLLEDARIGIRDTMNEDRETGENAVRETESAMRNTGTQLTQQLIQNTNTTLTDLTAFRAEFMKGALTSLDGALQQMRGEVTKQLAEISTRFISDVSAALGEAAAALQLKYTDATTDIIGKASGAKAAMNDSAVENRKGMEKAAYKIVNDTFWDKVGDFFSGLISGILGFLGDVILGILALVVAIIAIAVALAVLVAALALIVYGLALLVTYGLALLSAMLPLLLKGLTLFFIVDGAFSLVRGGVLIYKALTTPGLSFSERLSMVGQGLLEIASVIPVGKVLKVFKLGGRFTKFVSKVSSKVANSRIGKAVVEFAQHNFDVAGMLITKLGNKVDDIVTNIINGKIDKWTGMLFDKLLNGKWTGPLLRRVKPMYDKLLKHGDDAFAVARGEGGDVAARLAREKLERKAAQRVATHEAKELVEREAKKKLAGEGQKKLAKKAGKREGRKKKKDPNQKSENKWWKKQKTITASTKEKHRLFFTGERNNARLMINPLPVRRYTNFISTIDVNDNPEAASIKRDAMEVTNRIDTHISNYRSRREQRRDLALTDNQIVSEFDHLALLTLNLMEALGPSDAPPSSVTYGPTNAEGGATYADAIILSNNHKAGTVPQSKMPIWNKVNKRETQSVYIQGHLLNHNLGGEGEAHNLTPITGVGYDEGSSANRLHLDKVETFVKNAVTNGKVVRYRIDAIYGRHPNRSIQTNIHQRIGTPQERPDDRAKLELLNYEQSNVALSLKNRWAILKWDHGRWIDYKVMPTYYVKNTLPNKDFNLRP